MGSPPHPPAGDAGAGDELRPYRAGFWFGGFNGLTWMVCLGTPMVLLAEALRATTFQVGLVSSFVFLLLPVQLVATTWLPRFGFKRQMVAAWLLRAAFLFLPLGLALSAPAEPAPWMASLLVASVFGFCTFRAVGAVAHLPWFAAFLPTALRGRFFATDHAVTSTVGVATLLGSSALFALLPGYGAFQILYGVAIAGSLCAVWNLLRLPAVPAPETTPLPALLAEARALCLTRGLFRHYLLLMLLSFVVTSSFGAFSVYYLKVETGVAASAIMLFTAAQFAGQIAATWSIRRLLDRLPLRRFFQLAGLLTATVDVFWLVFLDRGAGVPGDHPLLLGVLALSYFVVGSGVAITNATHFTYLPELTAESRRHVGVAVFTAVHGVLAGLAPMLWGLLLKEGGDAPGIDTDHFRLYFCVGVGIALGTVGLFARLPETRQSLLASDPALAAQVRR